MCIKSLDPTNAYVNIIYTVDWGKQDTWNTFLNKFFFL